MRSLLALVALCRCAAPQLLAPQTTDKENSNIANKSLGFVNIIREDLRRNNDDYVLLEDKTMSTTQNRPIPNNTAPLSNKPEPLLNQPGSLLNQPRPIYNDLELLSNQPGPLPNQSGPLPNQPRPLYNEAKPLLTQLGSLRRDLDSSLKLYVDTKLDSSLPEHQTFAANNANVFWSDGGSMRSHLHNNKPKGQPDKDKRWSHKTQHSDTGRMPSTPALLLPTTLPQHLFPPPTPPPTLGIARTVSRPRPRTRPHKRQQSETRQKSVTGQKSVARQKSVTRQKSVARQKSAQRTSPSPDQLDMAHARGAAIAHIRFKGRLCQRSLMNMEGPSYDKYGREARAQHRPSDARGRRFYQTRAPRLVLPRCCNCCKKSVLGCQ